MEKQYPDDWVEKINEILNDIEISVFAKAVRAGHKLGFDGVGIQYIPFLLESQEEMTDVFGKRHKIRNIDGNPYPDYYGGYIKNRNDFNLCLWDLLLDQWGALLTHLGFNRND